MNDRSTDPHQSGRGRTDPRDPRAPTLLQSAGTDEPLAGRAVLLGLPYDGGARTRPGARLGPAGLRDALASFGTYDGVRELTPLLDLGDLALPTLEGDETHARIEAAAERVFSRGGWPLFVGGDHSCTGSIVRGLAAARPELRLALVSIDAHLDVREYQSRGSLSSGTPFRRALETGILSGDRTAMIGIRPFANSRYYLEWARGQRIGIYGVDEVMERGAAAVAREALDRVSVEADALYLSVDLDAAEAAAAPGVSASGVGGLSVREMIHLVRVVSRHPRLIGVDFMELAPPHDHDQRTAKLAARLMLEVLSAREEFRARPHA